MPEENRLVFRRAEAGQAEDIFRLVQKCISAVYPLYYRDEIVNFFCARHSLEHIAQDIQAGNVYVLEHGGALLGTGSFCQEHITRVYVASEKRGKGYGRVIMERLEQEIRKSSPTAEVDASLPASRFYERCGYQTVKHEQYPVGNGIILVYEIMKKDLQSG